MAWSERRCKKPFVGGGDGINKKNDQIMKLFSFSKKLFNHSIKGGGLRLPTASINRPSTPPPPYRLCLLPTVKLFVHCFIL